MEAGELAAAAVGVLAAVVTGTTAGIGEQGCAALVPVVRTRLLASERGRRALAGLETGPESPEARAEAAAVLRGEAEADAEFRRALALLLSEPATGPRARPVRTGSRFGTGRARFGGPWGPARRALLAVLLAGVVALLVYGGVRLFGGDDGTGRGPAGDPPRSAAYGAARQDPRDTLAGPGRADG
ncbi:hypothetical protein ACIGBL_19765 [Streptomyces sp. NPDC085614]|uniref:hypothetical protein n=1 Tax=Streptomyces sp. NPDC085614 TaxID=3365733 RepID=UPI0037D7C5B3